MDSQNFSIPLTESNPNSKIDISNLMCPKMGFGFLFSQTSVTASDTLCCIGWNPLEKGSLTLGSWRFNGWQTRSTWAGKNLHLSHHEPITEMYHFLPLWSQAISHISVSSICDNVTNNRPFYVIVQLLQRFQNIFNTSHYFEFYRSNYEGALISHIF